MLPRLILGSVVLFVCAMGVNAATPTEGISIESFLPVKPISRAARPAGVVAVIRNNTEAPVHAVAVLMVPHDISIVGLAKEIAVDIEAQDEAEVAWEVVATAAGPYELRVEARVEGRMAADKTIRMDFIEPLEMRQVEYIPEPEPVKTNVLVGAHACPLWEADKPEMWNQLLKHPERTPALGFYAQENPEVADWETKWAVEHGVSFFIYCWYRASQGKPVEMRFGSAIHDALFKSRFVDKMKFTIMWENQSRGIAGVADERDLMENLLPFWIDNYFTHSSYLKVDNKPVLFIYRPEFLVDDLGSEENVVRAFDLMRQACKEAGFDGLYLLGEYRGHDPKHLELMKRLGLDYTFAYCWYVPDNPTPEQAIETQKKYIQRTQDIGLLPQVVTLSQAWSGWADEGTIWKIPPEDFRTLLAFGKEFIATLPENELGSKMILLDNWNEWGEGHYIAPYREYGFGYLDAVREVFSDAPSEHVDLIPEDIGMGPYDTAYRTQAEARKRNRKAASERVLKAGAPLDGLVAWWAFDEADDSAVALDSSGHRVGGLLRDAKRTEGIDGRALICDGGCVVVEDHPNVHPGDEMTISCWVKTDVGGQSDKWMVNRIYSGGTATGYRLGLAQGKPCFCVPVTDWSHHVNGSKELPLGRWVHLAGTSDGKVVRLYMDGEEIGAMERTGAVNDSAFHLCLGNFEVGHTAFFQGLLDEVRLFNRALSGEEIRRESARMTR